MLILKSVVELALCGNSIMFLTGAAIRWFEQRKGGIAESLNNLNEFM